MLGLLLVFFYALIGRSLNAKSRILDSATRERRKQRQLQALEKDNFQEDPHAAFAHLIGKHKLPTFSDSNDGEVFTSFCSNYSPL